MRLEPVDSPPNLTMRIAHLMARRQFARLLPLDDRLPLLRILLLGGTPLRNPATEMLEANRNPEG